ncbi:MAG: serine hydrolase domain-containing protein [Chitinophagaceae bacterium]
MKKYILTFFVLCLLIIGKSAAQNYYFPPVTGNQWDSLPPENIGWCVNKLPSLYNYLASENTKAFIVLKDGKRVVEKYFGNFTQDSLWYWASAAKSLTGFLVGIAQQEGKLSINDVSSKYLGKGWTSLPEAKEQLITIKHQLSMTTGLDDNVADPFCTLPACLQYKADAGTRWAYHNAPYTLLDKVIESATEQTLNQYYTQKLKNVTGMKGLFVKQDFNNLLVSDARSLARFGLLILNKGKWGNTSIMTDAVYFNAMVNSSQSINPSYGYLWWLNGKSSYMIPQTQWVFNGSLSANSANDMFAAIGKNGQVITITPSTGMVVIRIGDAPDNSLVPFAIVDSIGRRMKEVACVPLATAVEPTIQLKAINEQMVLLTVDIPAKLTGAQMEILQGTTLSNLKIVTNTFVAVKNETVKLNFQLPILGEAATPNYFQVKLTDAVGNHSLSKVSVWQPQANKSFIKIYPNVIRQSFLSLQLKGIVSLAIIDWRGAVLLRKELKPQQQQLSIHLPAIGTGMYKLVGITEGGGIVTASFLKQ